MKTLKTIAPVLGAFVFLAGCSSTPKAPPALMNKPLSSITSHLPTAPATSSATFANPVIPAYLDPKSPIATERSVYFDFDDFSVKSEFDNLVQEHGKYLASHPAISIKVEGNADERGSAEYNLALGQKRAQAVVRALKVYGVKDTQLEAISWGKEKPKALGHDEAAWAQNRRADLSYPSK